MLGGVTLPPRTDGGVSDGGDRVAGVPREEARAGRGSRTQTCGKWMEPAAA